MKYIKYFESESSYYKELSEQEFDNTINDTTITDRFYKDEIYSIEKAIESSIATNYPHAIYIVKGLNYYYIYKLPDEWYCISSSSPSKGRLDTHKYYKCDQIEGLLKCIKEKII